MYNRTIWKDHVEGVQEGTDLSAANMNNIEARVMENSALTALNAEYSRYERDKISGGTEDLVSGVSPLATGSLYFVYK